jgi:hypothetical protein
MALPPDQYLLTPADEKILEGFLANERVAWAGFTLGMRGIGAIGPSAGVVTVG